MRAIDADALQLAIVEEGQANKRKKYIIGDIWELTGAEIREVINSQPTIQPEIVRCKDCKYWIPYDLLESERNSEYQRGLNEAWEAARKLFSSMADSDIEKAFPTEWNNGGFHALINLQPQEAIAKLKAYEEKQKADAEIKVGDEVVSKYSGIKGILLEPETEDVLATIIVPSQRWKTIYNAHENLEKTGKHYDIEKLLEAMKK